MKRDELDDLLQGLEPAEQERLRRAHELLLAADPPPELTPDLVDSPERPENVYPLFPRRRGAAAVLAAAAIAAAAFGIGFLVGDDSPPEPEFIVGMPPPGGVSDARASLSVFPVDEAGNWPMELTVQGLRGGVTYELWLTKKGELTDACGSFRIAGDTTVVPLNAPYRLRSYDGWVIVRTGGTAPVLTT